jgi:hypothetical protein
LCCSFAHAGAANPLTLPAGVQLDADFNARAQQAALLMAANNALDHFPPSNWFCYNATGGAAASKSDLALGWAGPAAIDGYMRDPGSSNAPVGHRRWILYPQTQLMGTGDVDGATRTNALWVQDSHIRDARPGVRDQFVAWPAAGYAPYQTVYARWSFAYPQADFSAATVSMSQGSVALPVRQESVANGFGENTLVWVPGGLADAANWPQPTADTPYRVTINNVLVAGQPRSFTYTVTVFDPDTGATAAPAVTGAAVAVAGQARSFGVTQVAAATTYQWRAMAATPYSLLDSAENGTGNFSLAISAGYTPVAAGVSASGGSSFHLAHLQPVDQTLSLNALLYANANTTLSFASALGLAGTGEVAQVEASADGGASWTALYQQRGTINTLSSSPLNRAVFTQQTVSLAAFAGQTVQIRFRYAYPAGGIYFPSAVDGIGWYIDDIRIANAETVATVAGPVDLEGPSFDFSPPGNGSVLLQARAGLYGYYGDWGAALPVAVSAAAAPAPTVSADCLFGWAERTVPQLFSAGTASITAGPWYVRFYPASGWYLGINSGTDHLYYLSPAAGLVDLGAKSGWFANAGCR